MDIIGIKNRILSSLYFAFVILCIIRITIFALNKIFAFSNVNFEYIFGFISVSLLCAFSAYCINDNIEKIIVVISSFQLSSFIYFAFSDSHYSMLFAIIYGVILSKFIKNINSYISIIVSVSFSLIVGFTFGYINQFISEWLLPAFRFISHKGALFGIINNLYSVIISNKFEYLFYHTDYSSTMLINNKIISGAVDIFSQNNSASIVSKYLTGKYFVNIFLSIGLFISLKSKLDKNAYLPFLLIIITAIITGDVRLLSLYVLIYNPFIYIGYLFVVFVSYAVSRFIDLRIGFIDNGNIIELIQYGNAWLYFIITGVILSVLMYYIVLIIRKIDFLNRY